MRTKGLDYLEKQEEKGMSNNEKGPKMLRFEALDKIENRIQILLLRRSESGLSRSYLIIARIFLRKC